MDKPILYSYFRSSCSWRVRIALTVKGIEYETKSVHLLKKEQLGPEYLELNPMGQVPALYINGTTLTQSISILEYLEEVFPQVPLMPKDPLKRAKVREICEIIAGGIQPIQNNSVIRKFSPENESERNEWAKYWITTGFIALEKILVKSVGKYCVSDDLSLADCCLVPQVYNANRFNVDLSAFPTIKKLNESLMELEAFKVSAPSSQPDCPPELK